MRWIRFTLAIAMVFLLATDAGGATGKWTKVTISGAPQARKGHTAVYDSQNKRMILFGGEGEIPGCTESIRDTFFQDIWALSLDSETGLAWDSLETDGGLPKGREDHSAIYDSKNKRMVVFGGEYNDGATCGTAGTHTRLGDTWFLDLDSALTSPEWDSLAVANTACFRDGHSAVYDPAGDGKMIVYGGMICHSPSGATCNSSNEIQTPTSLVLHLDSTPSWESLDPSTGGNCDCSSETGQGTCNWPGSGFDNPLRSWYHAAIWDPVDDEMLVSGGSYLNNNPTVFGTTRVLDTDAEVWDNLTPTLTRENHRAIYDSQNETAIVFGGSKDGEGPTTWFDTVHEWDLRASSPTWVDRTSDVSDCSTESPAAREWHTFVYDPVFHRVILFGGIDANGDLYNDTWILELDSDGPEEIVEEFGSSKTNCINITWEAPEDVPCGDAASSYDVRYATSPINSEADWNNATQASNPPTPSSPSTTEYFTIDGLSSCTTYHIAVRAADEKGNISPLGDDISAQTKCSGAACLPGFSAQEVRSQQELELAGPQPNPASARTLIRFVIPEHLAKEPVSIRIYDLAGRMVRKFGGITFADGSKTLEWDLRTETGDQVRAGAYFVRLRVGPEEHTRTLLVQR